MRSKAAEILTQILFSENGIETLLSSNHYCDILFKLLSDDKPEIQQYALKIINSISKKQVVSKDENDWLTQQRVIPSTHGETTYSVRIPSNFTASIKYNAKPLFERTPYIDAKASLPLFLSLSDSAPYHKSTKLESLVTISSPDPMPAFHSQKLLPPLTLPPSLQNELLRSEFTQNSLSHFSRVSRQDDTQSRGETCSSDQKSSLAIITSDFFLSFWMYCSKPSQTKRADGIFLLAIPEIQDIVKSRQIQQRNQTNPIFAKTGSTACFSCSINKMRQVEVRLKINHCSFDGWETIDPSICILRSKYLLPLISTWVHIGIRCINITDNLPQTKVELFINGQLDGFILELGCFSDISQSPIILGCAPSSLQLTNEVNYSGWFESIYRVDGTVSIKLIIYIIPGERENFLSF